MHWSGNIVLIIVAVIVGAYLGTKIPMLNVIGKVLP